MKNSDIIFWSTMFFIVSWLIGYYWGLRSMFRIWYLWLIIYLIYKSCELYYRLLQKLFQEKRFD